MWLSSRERCQPRPPAPERYLLTLAPLSREHCFRSAGAWSASVCLAERSGPHAPGQEPKVKFFEASRDCYLEASHRSEVVPIGNDSGIGAAGYSRWLLRV